MRRGGTDRDRAGAHRLREPRHGVGRVWWRAGASLGALALVLGACSGVEPAEPAEPTEPEDPNGETDADPEPNPEPTADETASGPPEVEPPEVPDIHREDDQGAQNAAEYFLELYSYVFMVDDTTMFEELSSPNCQFCANVIDRAEEMHAAGEYYEGGYLTFAVEETYPPIDDDPRFLIRFSADQESITHRAPDGSEILRTDSDSDVQIDVALILDEDHGQWLIDGVEIDAEE